MEELIGQSKAIQRIRRRIQQLARARRNITIVGEQGVGKSVVAKSIHLRSLYSQKPFVHLVVNIADELNLRSVVQMILTKREFVNPEISQHGNFSLPGGTSLILDNVENLSTPGQRIIIDLLQGLEAKTDDIRTMMLLTSTHRNLIKEGRLVSSFENILKDWDSLAVPPLRERVEDIPELIEHFVRRAAAELNLGEMVIDINAVSILVRKEWKGNIQELKTFVEQAIMLSEGKETFTLPAGLIDEQSELSTMLRRIDDGIEFALDRSMELIERRILERVLMKCGFNQSKAARFLKITEDTLRYRMKKLGIRTESQN